MATYSPFIEDIIFYIPYNTKETNLENSNGKCEDLTTRWDFLIYDVAGPLDQRTFLSVMLQCIVSYITQLSFQEIGSLHNFSQKVYILLAPLGKKTKPSNNQRKTWKKLFW